MAILTDAEYDADILMAITDSPATFTYVDVGEPTPNIQTGVVTPDTTNYAITGIREELQTPEIELSKGKFAYGDILFFVRVTDLAVTPDSRDQIIDGADTFNFIEHELDPTQRMWIIVGRKQTL